MIELRLPGTFHFNTFWSPRARRCRQVTIAAASSDAAKFDQPCEKRAINAPELGPWNAPEKIARHFQKKTRGELLACGRAGYLLAQARRPMSAGGRRSTTAQRTSSGSTARAPSAASLRPLTGASIVEVPGRLRPSIQYRILKLFARLNI
jgi:hypothetical protein